MDVQRLLITLKRKAKTLEKSGSLFKTSLNFLVEVVKETTKSGICYIELYHVSNSLKDQKKFKQMKMYQTC